jgi:hypothetical protein
MDAIQPFTLQVNLPADEAGSSAAEQEEFLKEEMLYDIANQ